MKQLTILEKEKLELVDSPSLEVPPNFVKVKVQACGICGSDIALLNGFRDRKTELYFGHEFTGVVEAIGENVHGLSKGMRVASGIIKTCGVCWNCRNGHPNYCKGLNSVLKPGGFAEETLVEHSDDFQFLTPLPEEVDDIAGTLHETVSCVLRIVERAQIKTGQTVLIIGLGAIGVIAGELFKYLGASKVIGMDISLEKTKVAQELKFDKVIDRNNKKWISEIYEEVGPQGVDIIVEATGSSMVLSDAFEVARKGAQIIIGSVYHGPANNLDLLPILRKELTVIGAKGSYPYTNSNDESTAMNLLKSNVFTSSKITKVYKKEEFADAFEDAKGGKCIKPVIRFND
ncbi:zinc-binding dehydrogenase [Oceanobacillus sp. CFH 90083]|uniref:zinc-dependent alcohol dehydrogenase n=1 Tax=Oceanobacillus sp. CFH 90083 TaxID=2592336 RepID=UPI00128B371A|nr:alcohol dehydrogenase catalytic domain-containing protein [Oceanobacillus sp. CFH 90083]